jgi:hypothetical protein
MCAKASCDKPPDPPVRTYTACIAESTSTDPVNGSVAIRWGVVVRLGALVGRVVLGLGPRDGDPPQLSANSGTTIDGTLSRVGLITIGIS